MEDLEAPAAAPRRAPPATNAAGAGSAAPAALRERPFAIYEAAVAARPARTTTAAALRELLTRVADAMLLGLCGVSWVNLAANGVAIGACWACGEDSRAAAVAKKAADAAIVAMGVLLPVAGPRLLRIIERWPKAGVRQVLGFEIPFVPFLPQFATPFLSLGFTNCVGVDENLMLGDPVLEWSHSQEGQHAARSSCKHWRWSCPNGGPVSAMLAMLVVQLCFFTKFVPQVIEVYLPAKRYNQEKSSVSFGDMASLISILVLCFYLIPYTTIKLRRMM
ncbi:unnamed protein product [Urochloa decumbens]|uniref:Uncharacterized protein n=1 Tax=Urochloa decumbens TaxID=240449 RepID=A0ABC9BBS8_9POAL